MRGSGQTLPSCVRYSSKHKIPASCKLLKLCLHLLMSEADVVMCHAVSCQGAYSSTCSSGLKLTSFTSQDNSVPECVSEGNPYVEHVMRNRACKGGFNRVMRHDCVLHFYFPQPLTCLHIRTGERILPDYTGAVPGLKADVYAFQLQSCLRFIWRSMLKVNLNFASLQNDIGWA